MKKQMKKEPIVIVRHKTFSALLALSMMVLIAPAARANPISGNLVLSGHLTEVIAVNGNVIDFDFTGGVTNTFPPLASDPNLVDGNGDSGLFDIAGASTDSFAPLIGTTVVVHDLDRTQQPIGVTSGPGLPLSNFIKFSAQPTWNLTLTQVLPGAFGTAGCGGAPAAGQTCSPANSPFNLANLAGNQVNVSFAFLGTINDGQGNISNINGTFGTTFSNTSLQAILAAISAGSSVVTSGSATIAATITPIPEPGAASLFLLGVTLIAGALATRRRHHR